MDKTERNISILNKEISFIKNENIKKFTIESLKMLPEYFWEIPASSTGKYHPKYTLGVGGLIRHTQSAVRIAVQLFDNQTVQNFNELEKDMVICALILHDGVKKGFDEKEKYTQTKHPIYVVELLKSNSALIDIVGKDVANEIFEGIRSHMGQWNSDYKTKEKVLPLPKGEMQKFIHLCDYLASRKTLEFNFDVDIERK